ncbi:MAG: hypothetical protein JST92_13775 [Deltaproteobacteria bacterium]|nr:hypothetical protein [Deltaproteobacteria bacterium]
MSSTPLLDTRITLPPGKTDPRTFLRDLCDAISKARHTKLIPFTLNAPGLRGRRVFAGAKDEVARDVLASYLAAIDPQISWSVLCEPHVTCGLNLHRVAPRPAR